VATYPRRLGLTNPGFEAGTAPGDGWTTVNGTPVFRSTTPGPDLRGGARYLHVNNTGAAGSYRVRQDLGIPAECHADADAGLLSASLRFLWANYGAGNDIGFVELAFLNGADAVISTAASGSLGDSAQAWSQKVFTAAVPANTRKVRILLGGTWASGSSTDSYFDAIELELIETASAAAEVHQFYAELIETTDTSAAQVVQVYGELIETTDTSLALVSQLYAELIRSVADKPATASGGAIVCIIAG
jgi:hypothetical protein